MKGDKGKIAVVDFASCSLTGNRHNNQDRCLVAKANKALLLGIADGMGGHPGGDSAAQIFIETCQRVLDNHDTPLERPRDFLTRLLQSSHQQIRQFGQQQSPPITPRTTAVLALLQDGLVRWVHAGDSRFYLFRDGKVAARTSDHSQVEQMHRQGLINRHQMLSHPRRNLVTRCLGGDGAIPEPEYGEHQLASGDRILLCTDGLWSSMREQRIASVLFARQGQMTDKVTDLAREATRTQAPESDNVSLVACRIATIEVE